MDTLKDKLFFFSQPLTPRGASYPVAFSALANKFLNAIDRKRGQRFFIRWSQDGEPLELVLDDFIRQEIKARIDTTASFNQLLTALIVFSEGGDYARILDQDAEELFSQYKNELDQVQAESPDPGFSAIAFSEAEEDIYIRDNPYAADPDTWPGGPIK